MTRPPQVSFTREGAGPPSPFYLFRDDRLFVRSRNSLAGVRLGIRGRLLDTDGRVIPFQYSHTPATDRSVVMTLHDLAEGFLLSLSVFADAGTPRRGETWVQVGLGRGPAANFEPVALLVSEYATAADAIGWPGGSLRSSVEGPGFLRTLLGTNPDAGAEVSETVPTDARWNLLSLFVQFVTSAVAGSRRPHITLDDGVNKFAHLPILTSITVSQTADLTWMAGTSPWAPVLQGQVCAIPAPTLLLAGSRIQTVTSGLLAGDNYAAPVLQVEEWIED